MPSPTVGSLPFSSGLARRRNSCDGLNIAAGSAILTDASGSFFATGIIGLTALRPTMLRGILLWRGNRLPRLRDPKETAHVSAGY